jgi:hypothetical protein
VPKKKEPLTPEEQSERFRAAVRAAINPGELNSIEADEAFDKLVRKSRIPKGDVRYPTSN